MRHWLRNAFVIALAAFGASSLGGHRAAGEQGAARLGTDLEIDAHASRVYIKVGAQRMGHLHAVQGRLADGTISLGGRGEMVFDMKTFVVDPPEARRYLGLAKDVSDSDRNKVTATMLGPQVLDVSRFPRAVFTIASVAPLDGQAAGAPGRYELTGDFALHGVTRRLQISAKLEPTDKPSALRMRGSFSILQTQYGITPYTALAGLVKVADTLEISGDLVLVSTAGRRP
jgi:polyisoprenoid-binding protein YceI